MKEGIKVSPEKAAEIERLTRGQSRCQRWFDEKKWRITASKFGDVCKSGPDRDLDILASNIYDPPNLSGYPAVRHGLMYEATALERFTSQTGKNIKGCGLFILPEFPFLGASPDGLVEGEDAIVEVKCPYAAKDKKILPGKHIPYLEYSGDKIQLKKNHSHHYQIQGQLMLSGRKKCYFIVYTMCDLLIEEIPFDRSFFEEKMQSQLENFYEKVYCPYVAAEIIKPK